MFFKSSASKSHFASIFTAVLATLFLMGCSKDDDNGGTDNDNTSKISATIDGQAWTGNMDNVTRTPGSVQLYATKEDDSSIQIFLTEDTIGTFQFPSTVATINYVEDQTFWNNNISGSITVVNNGSNKISGTFNTVSVSPSNMDTVVIQDGSFNWQKN